MPLRLLLVAVLLAVGCTAGDTPPADPPTRPTTTDAPAADVLASVPDTLAEATFAGGCFWCMEPPYEKLDGVTAVISGFSGGPEVDPTYDAVASGRTGHAEVVRVIYDPDQVTYAELLEVFWRNVDPTVDDRQFCDVGAQYRPAIFYHDSEQERLARASREQIEASGRFDRVVVEVSPMNAFYPAEAYHQDFYKTNPERYYSYREGCGRDARLEALWGDDPPTFSFS